MEGLFLDWLISGSVTQCVTTAWAIATIGEVQGLPAFLKWPSVILPEALRGTLTHNCEIFISCSSQSGFSFVRCQGHRTVGYSLWVLPTVSKNSPSIPVRVCALNSDLCINVLAPPFHWCYLVCLCASDRLPQSLVPERFSGFRKVKSASLSHFSHTDGSFSSLHPGLVYLFGLSLAACAGLQLCWWGSSWIRLFPPQK